MTRLSFNEAAKRLGISRRELERYVIAGEEIPYIREQRGKVHRYFIEEHALQEWRSQRDSRLVRIDEAGYFKCLKFGLASYYGGHPRSDFGTTRRRSAGKFVDDFTRGKLGEVALRRFLKREFGITIGLDFDPTRGAVVGQDIVDVRRPPRNVVNPPRLRVAVKTTKRTNAWLLVPENEVELDDRRSDIYVLVRVDLYGDHLFRGIRTHEALAGLAARIPKFDPIEAEVAGFAWRSDLKHAGTLEQLPVSGQQLAHPNYALKTGQLRRSPQEWDPVVAGL